MKLSLQSQRLSTSYIVKLVLSIAATIYLLISVNLDEQHIRELFGGSTYRTIPTGVLLCIVVLMPLNWYVEALKWRKLQVHAHTLTLRESVEGVLMGIPVTWFTPNGIASFLGRMWRVKQEQRELAVASTIVGNLAQLLTTLIFGLIGGFVVVTQQPLLDGTIYVPVIAGAMLLGITWFLANLSTVLPKLMNSFRYFRDKPHVVNAIQGLNRKTLAVALGYSCTRYLIFSLQMWLLLVYLGGLTDANVIHVALISVYYLIKAGWPTIMLGEVGAKGVILQSLFGTDLLEASYVLIPFILWLLNTIVPGVVGLALLYKARVS